jgi:hypothetical protein
MSSHEGFGGQRTRPLEDTPAQHRSVALELKPPAESVNLNWALLQGYY